jgi:hypothetical protein
METEDGPQQARNPVIDHETRGAADELRADNPCTDIDLSELNNGTAEVRHIRFFQPVEWSLFRSCVNPDFLLLLDLL